MNKDAVGLVEQADRYAHVFDDVGGADRFEGSGSDGPIRLAPDGDLVRGLASLSKLIRLAEAERTKLAGEIGRRSQGDKDVSLARQMGTTGATDLVGQVAGVRSEDAHAIVALGDAIRVREAITGEALEPKHPHIAAALAAGSLDRVVASAMVRALAKAAPGLTPTELLDLEGEMVAFALEGHPVGMLLAYCKTVPDFAHPEGAQGRERAIRETAKVTKRALASGLTRWVLDLDPETAGLFNAALDANLARNRFRIITPDQHDNPDSTDDNDSDDTGNAGSAESADGSSTATDGDGARTNGAGGSVGWGGPVGGEERDTRPLPVRRVDAVALLARNALKVDEGQVAGTAVTMLVHIGLDALLTGVGAATITGVEGTISAATARKLACEAEIIPVVLGGDSQPLDLGTARRFFTEPQRRAMAARDRGCAGPNCDAPLSWTQAAHIRPAGRGPTSVDNGILLCPRCHRLHDDEGWQVRRTNGRWWWTPPPHIDYLRTPRPGGPIPPPTTHAPAA